MVMLQSDSCFFLAGAFLLAGFTIITEVFAIFGIYDSRCGGFNFFAFFLRQLLFFLLKKQLPIL